jgi:hypothetical protein
MKPEARIGSEELRMEKPEKETLRPRERALRAAGLSDLSPCVSAAQ